MNPTSKKPPVSPTHAAAPVERACAEAAPGRAEEVEPTVVPVAPYGHSNLLATSRGVVGVLYATNEGLPEVGSQQLVRLVFPGDESVLADTVVAFHRKPRSDERWPAAGLQFTLGDARRDSLVTRFARFREPTFVPDELLVAG